jgi:MFS family permease
VTPGGSSGSAAPERPPVPLILAITVTGIMGNTLVAPASPDIVASFGRSAAAVGPLLAAATAPGIVLAPLIGVLADRWGRRAVLVPCLAIFGLAGGLGAFAPTFPLLLLCRLGQGVGSAGLVNLAVVIIGDNWEGTERARMIGRNAAALTAAIAVMPTVGGALTSLAGWRAAFFPYWLALGTVAAVLRWLPAARPTPTSFRSQLQATLPQLRDPVVLGTLATGFTVFALIFGLYLTVLPVHLDQTFGVGPAGRGVALGIPSAASTAIALHLGRLRGRFGGRTLVFAGLLTFAVSFGLLAGGRHLAFVGVAALVYGVAEGLSVPTLQDVITGAAPAESRGAVVALFVSVSRAGQTAGPILAAGLMAASSPAATFAAGVAVALLLAAGHRLARPGGPGQVLAPPIPNSLP